MLRVPIPLIYDCSGIFSLFLDECPPQSYINRRYNGSGSGSGTSGLGAVVADGGGGGELAIT